MSIDLTTSTADVDGRTYAMATDVSVQLVPPEGTTTPAAEAAVGAALDVFHRVDATSTRFRPDSPLMQANAAGDEWHAVPAECYGALREAHRAHQMTGGLFDPRVLRDLVRIGYARSMRDGVPIAVDAPDADRGHGRLRPWRPGFRDDCLEVRVGPLPVDLGGIGKGLAVRWAAQAMAATSPSYLVDAGGDCYCAGEAPDGGPWRVGVEDPSGAAVPVAVLQLSDRACTTSSVRLRRWRAGGREVHHLIDPRTGLPGGDGLLSVTVVGPDPALAEVWSKVLFLAGRGSIGAEAERRGLAALWIDTNGAVAMSAAMTPHVLWRSS